MTKLERRGKAAAALFLILISVIALATVKDYTGSYDDQLKAKQAAQIFDEMVDENQIQLVARILAQMTIENRGDILAQMEKPNAAKLTQLLEPTALEKESTQVTGEKK